jgi:hypothetical protein
VALGHLQFPLCDTEETGRGAVATAAFVMVAVGAVEVVQGILVGAAALATYD